MRIEVGYGLEGALTDVVADRIRNLMTPRFREGNYDVGVEAGVTAIIQSLEGKQSSEDEWAATATRASGFHVAPAPLPLAERVLVSLFVFGIVGLFTFVGIVTPGSMGWFLYFFLIPFWSIFPLALFGSPAGLIIVGGHAALYPLAQILVRRTPWYQKAREDLKTKALAHIGGMTLMAGGRDGSSRGFSSGGGFSGGGGSSGWRGRQRKLVSRDRGRGKRREERGKSRADPSFLFPLVSFLSSLLSVLLAWRWQGHRRNARSRVRCRAGWNR